MANAPAAPTARNPQPHSYGGVRFGGGKDSMPPELRRSVPAKCQLRPAQASDLQAIADAWGVPIGTALYGVIATFLAECHAGPMLDDRDTLPIRASRILLARMGETVAPREPEPPG